MTRELFFRFTPTTCDSELISELTITEGNKRERQDYDDPAFLPALQLLGPTELHYGYFGSPDGNF